MFSIPGIGTENSVLPQMEQSRLNLLKGKISAGNNKTDEELMSVSRQFESIFIHQLLKSMRSTIQKSGLFDSHATRMYESMHDQELASLMSEKRSIGLADMIYKDLMRLEKKINKQNSENNQAENNLEPKLGILG